MSDQPTMVEFALPTNMFGGGMVAVQYKDITALRSRISELEAELEQSCEHCGARVYSGPPDCPRCAAPQCCPQCCKIDTLSRRITELEAERDRLREALSWSFIRTLLSQGMSIQQDYDAGKYKDYEEVSARLDAAARERCAALQEGE